MTNEFLGMPARLTRIEKDIAEIKGDIAEIKADVAEIKADVAEIKTDVAYLKGTDLELRLHQKIRTLTSQALKLRRAHVVQGPFQEPQPTFIARIEDALDDGQITSRQEGRVDNTDFVLTAQRREDRSPVWIAVEASNQVHASDIERARASADALHAIFGTDVMAVVAGYGIHQLDADRAKAAEVTYLQLSQFAPA